MTAEDCVEDGNSSTIVANIVSLELGVKLLHMNDFCLSTFGCNIKMSCMAVFDNCSSVNIFNNETFFKDTNFSPAAILGCMVYLL